MVLAATVRVAHDLDLAEECVQDAYAQALRVWATKGVPDRPGAWLTTVARNRAKDIIRRESVLRAALPMLVMDDGETESENEQETAVEDDRLRLIFTCCHPALSQEAQVALTLRLMCGLSTVEVARAFLVREPTMAARLTRAKKKISAARIPYRVPAPGELPERVSAVLEVVHLAFTTGHLAPTGEQLVRRDLVDSAIQLARTLHQLLPDQAEIDGLLALMLLTDARRDTRLSDDGRVVLLADQDRSRWDAGQIAEGAALLTGALRGGPPSPYALQAAIAAVHAQAASWAETDWAEIVGLYDVLHDLWPSPVVELNRAVAIGFRDGPLAGLTALTPLLNEPTLARYPYLSAARADFLRRLERFTEAADAYEEAVVMTDNEVERAFLTGRLAAVRALG
jgi:RNA polymerase sigma-70 factor (ECF subfamily)